METRLIAASREGIAEAARLLKEGAVVGVPAETVYGLAARSSDDRAVARIFEAKARPSFDPLIVHLAESNQLDEVADVPVESEEVVDALIEQFWPGPLTMVLPKREAVSDLVTSGLPTVAVRCTSHPILQQLIELAGPLAAPSANRFGRISPTTAEAVLEELNGRIPLILDDGPVLHGVESTIVRITNRGALEILRPGPVTPEALQAVAPVGFSGRQVGEVPHAPGMLAQHYAPAKPLRLQDWQHDLPGPAESCALLGWRSVPVDLRTQAVAFEILSERGDLKEAATRLFAAMRRLDASRARWLVAEPVPEHGIGLAIMDRLRRAAAGSGDSRE